MKLMLKVVPGASRDEISGWLGDRLKVRVRAPAESGRANAAVISLVASQLALPKHAVRLVAGGTSPRKSLEIDADDEADVRARLTPSNA